MNPREHGFADLNELVRRVRQEAEYLKLFAQAFPDDADAISVSNIATAVASFERTLLAGDSPFDRYFYDGQHDALSPSAQRGMMLFRGRAGRFVLFLRKRLLGLGDLLVQLALPQRQLIGAELLRGFSKASFAQLRKLIFQPHAYVDPVVAVF